MKRDKYRRPVNLSIVISIYIASVNQLSAAIQFDNVTTSAGISFTGETYGASWGDVNTDGLPDIFVSHHRTLPGLYVNNGDGTFSDLGGSVPTWANSEFRDTHGGSWADFDNDGDQDFMVGTGRGNDNQFFVNEAGQLIDRTTQYNLNYSSWAGRLATWFDFDQDGKLDFLMGQFNGDSQLLQQTGSGFNNFTSTAGISCTLTTYAQLFDINDDGSMELLCGRSGAFPHKAYDVSTLPFTNVTSSLPSVSSVADTALADFDRDLRQDIFYVRGTVRPSGIKQHTSTDIEIALVGDEKGFVFNSDGSITVDIDWQPTQDGDLNKLKIGSSGASPLSIPFTLNPSDTSNWGLKPHDPADSPVIYIGYDNASNKWTFIQYSGGSFSNAYLQISATTNITGLLATGFGASEGPLSPVLNLNYTSGFVNQTETAGLSAAISCTSVVAADFDNDMDLDIFLACRSGAENLPNILYENRGNGVFDLVPGAGGAEGVTGAAVGSGAGTADSVVVADYDVDGFIDLFIANGINMRPTQTGGPDQLFHNRGNSNNWIEIDLEGTLSNRDGVGARVIATAGGVAQLREQNGGYHRWSQNHQRLHFGLASNNTVDLVITWPSGTQDTHNNVVANRLYRAVEGGGIVPVTVGGGPTQSTIYISDTSVTEGDGPASFDVTLSPSSADPVTVDYATADGSATDGADYSAVTGTLLFNAGDTSKQVQVPVIDDGVTESNETFTVILSNPTAAVLGDSSGTGTIIDDEVTACGEPAYDNATDHAVFLWEDCPGGTWHARYTAGNGYTQYTGNVTATQPFGSVVPYSIESTDILDWTSDPNEIVYVLKISPPYEDGYDFSYPPGSNVCFNLELPVDVPVLIGASRTPMSVPFDLATLGSCVVAVESILSIADVATPEADGIMNFTVSLLPASTDAVTVNYLTSDNSATGGLDYEPAAGTLLFNAGETSGQVSVTLYDDVLFEGDESFTLTLSDEINAFLGDANATGTIIDDDVCPSCHTLSCPPP